MEKEWCDVWNKRGNGQFQLFIFGLGWEGEGGGGVIQPIMQPIPIRGVGGTVHSIAHQSIVALQPYSPLGLSLYNDSSSAGAEGHRLPA